MSEASKKQFPPDWLIGQSYDPNEHMLNLKGKAYLDVQNRLLWFVRDQRALIAAGLAASTYLVRTEIVEQAHREQQQVMERARQEIETERQQAMVELRRDTVNLAVRSASKVIEKNLDDETNRRVVESFLASLEPASH